MNHSLGMRRAQAFGDAVGDVQGQRHIEGFGSSFQKVAQVGAVDILHGEEERSVFRALGVAAVHDIAVAHLAQRPHLAQEAAGEVLVFAQLR
jgi:hypothetical protein